MLQVTDQCPSIHERHVVISHDQVERFPSGDGNGVSPIGNLKKLRESEALEDVSHVDSSGAAVIDNEHAELAAIAPRSRRFPGSGSEAPDT